MNTISKDVIFTQEINKSTFTTYLKRVTTVEEAKAYINEIKLLHPNATHHVTTYIIGNSGEYGHANDDGEPSGTSALPAMDVFKKNNVTNVVCIIVRYFGGIKLGAGGLVRAYSSSAALSLKEAGISEIIPEIDIKLSFNYSYLNQIENRIKNYQIISKNFSTNVEITLTIPKREFEELQIYLISLTNNQIGIEILDK